MTARYGDTLEWCELCDRYHVNLNSPNIDPNTADIIRVKHERTQAYEDLKRDAIDRLQGARCVGDYYLSYSTLINQMMFNTKVGIQERNYIRIASWNVRNNRTDDHIESICSTILHHNFDVVAFQETGKDETVLNKIYAEMQRRSHYYCANPRIQSPNISGGFLWKEDVLHKMYDRKWNHSYYRKKITVVRFQINDTNKSFTLCNFHCTPQDNRIRRNGLTGYENNEREINKLNDYASYINIQKPEFGIKNFILLGDFNDIPPPCMNVGAERFEALLNYRYHTNTIRNATYDNIILHEDIERECRHYGVGNMYNIKDQVLSTSSAINVSDHLPIWVDIPITAFITPQ